MSFTTPLGLPDLGLGMPTFPALEIGGIRKPMTEGMPDPAAVQRQKEAYARSLEDQLKRGVEVLAATYKQQSDQLHAQANRERHQFNLALDQRVKERELELSQKYNEQLMRLQQAAQAQRAELDQQACGLTLEYQQMKVQEEYIAQQEGIQRQHIQAQNLLNAEIEKFGPLLERVQTKFPVPPQMPMQQPSPPPIPVQYAAPPPAMLRPPAKLGGSHLAPLGMTGNASFMPPIAAPPFMKPVGSFVPAAFAMKA